MTTSTTGLPVPPPVAQALDRLDPDDAAWITITADEAVARARLEVSGPLSGLTFAVKDLFDTRGVRTTYGSKMYADHHPHVTASVITNLERAGAVSLGKTNLNEFAYGVSGYNPTYGMIRSPLNRNWTAGGSSGGSAAVVGAGIVDFAVGSDTSGSARIPATCCGVIGFKCAHGSQPLDGVYPLAPGRDSIGYFCRDVEVLQRIFGLPVLPPTDRVISRASSTLNLPPIPDEQVVLFRAESYVQHKSRSLLYPDLYGRDLKLKMRPEDQMSELAAAQIVGEWRRDFTAAARSVDVITMPVFEGSPPTVDEVLADYEADSLASSDRLLAYTVIASVLGWAAMAVPTKDGSLQLIAPPEKMPEMLAVAKAMALPAAEQINR